MFETMVRWVGDIYTSFYHILVYDMVMTSVEVLTAARSSSIRLDAQVALIVGSPAVLIIGFVWCRKRSFERRHGSSAANGWKWTITSFAIGWLCVILAVMRHASGTGAWAAATLAPVHLWPIGLLAMIAITYGTLGANWLTRKSVRALRVFERPRKL